MTLNATTILKIFKSHGCSLVRKDGLEAVQFIDLDEKNTERLIKRAWEITQSEGRKTVYKEAVLRAYCSLKIVILLYSLFIKGERYIVHGQTD